MVRRLLCLPQDMDDRLLTLGLLFRDPHSPPSSVPMPLPLHPITNSDQAKNIFYMDLHALLASVSKMGKWVSLADFNARVEIDHTVLEVLLRPHCLGGCN
ncbi:unnamed protein product [Dibothriocephalus latus]|uniref:Uncharacterized protein n=1 Tax=Dibothriocephalus latus TaxID=60516 RepID=A0A3P7NVC1_DIBLA|nr:unnamed protein product [Dibothriocephalus latus]